MKLHIVALAAATITAGIFAAEPNMSEKAQSRLEKEVRHELVTLPYYGVFDNFLYGVSPDGTVTLRGQVRQPQLKSNAEKSVKDIEGVTKIVNEIEVLPLSPSDDSLRNMLYRNIFGQATLNRYSLQAVPPIHIIVKNGQVALEGVVATEADKNVAGIQANGVSGVFGVKNNLRVEAKD